MTLVLDMNHYTMERLVVVPYSLGKFPPEPLRETVGDCFVWERPTLRRTLNNRRTGVLGPHVVTGRLWSCRFTVQNESFMFCSQIGCFAIRHKEWVYATRVNCQELQDVSSQGSRHYGKTKEHFNVLAEKNRGGPVEAPQLREGRVVARLVSLVHSRGLTRRFRPRKVEVAVVARNSVYDPNLRLRETDTEIVRKRRTTAHWATADVLPHTPRPPKSSVAPLERSYNDCRRFRES